MNETDSETISSAMRLLGKRKKTMSLAAMRQRKRAAKASAIARRKSAQKKS